MGKKKQKQNDDDYFASMAADTARAEELEREAAKKLNDSNWEKKLAELG